MPSRPKITEATWTREAAKALVLVREMGFTVTMASSGDVRIVHPEGTDPDSARKRLLPFGPYVVELLAQERRQNFPGPSPAPCGSARHARLGAWVVLNEQLRCLVCHPAAYHRGVALDHPFYATRSTPATVTVRSVKMQPTKRRHGLAYGDGE